MSAKKFLTTRCMVGSMILMLAGIPELANAAQETAQPSSQTDGQDQSSSPKPDPDSPGATKMQGQTDNPAGNGAVPATQSSPSAGQRTTPAKPLGTAAAEPLTPSGVGASEPAGVAIAPAKQRRTRSLLIKVGAIVGAGVALGTVFALSNATSSKPPGSH
jgi:hypothetical protein